MFLVVLLWIGDIFSLSINDWDLSTLARCGDILLLLYCFSSTFYSKMIGSTDFRWNFRKAVPNTNVTCSNTNCVCQKIADPCECYGLLLMFIVNVVR
jgi:hypothetical protein